MAQTKIGWRPYVAPTTVTESTLLTSLYSVWNADTTSSTLDSSIYGAWNGENNANDSVGTNHGTLMNGCTFTTGKLGQAFTFDGVNDYVALPSNTMNLTGDFTISFWVNLSSLTGHQFFISNVVNQSSLYRGFAIVKNNTTNLINVQFYNSNSSVDVFSSSAMVANTWYNIVLTRKSGVSTKLYVNGVLSGSNTSTMDPNYYTSQACQIGGYNNTASPATYFTNGNIDSLTTWNKAISQDEVTQLYNLGTGTQYPFSGQTLPSANNQFAIDNGTLMNGCTFTDGKIGKAFTFDGVNDYVQLPKNSLSVSGDFSLSVWLYYINGGQHQMIVGNFDYTGGATLNGWNLFNSVPQVGNTTTNNPIQFSIGNGTSSVNLQATVRENPFTWYANNTWYHFVITRKAGQRTRIYRNGVLDTENTSTFDPTYLPNTTPSIGAGYYASYPSTSSPLVQYFMSNGSKVDGFSFWQKELTQSEVTELYNSGAGKQLTVATPIVTNGLVLNLDASRLSSYPNAGTTWTDISGNGNNGTMVNGPVYNSSNGGQITFDGVNDYVDLGTITSLNLINISISVWVKPMTTTDYMPIIGRYANTTSNNGWEMYYFKSTNKFYFGGRESASSYLQLMSNNTYSINNWYNITGVKSGNVWSLYVNGVLDNSLTLGSGTITFGTNSMQIGGELAGGTWYYGKSDISQSIIYNRALSSTEITQNYNATKSRFGL